MIIDHIGYYFFPEEMMFRAIGRSCVPIWFFLIGYARSRDLTWPILAGAGSLIVANVIVGMPIFAVNILGTIIFVRLLIDYVAEPAMHNTRYLFAISIIMAVLYLPSFLILEYGTMGLILALYGYFLRHQQESGIPAQNILGFGFFAFFSYLISQFLVFDFSKDEAMVMTVTTGFSFFILYFFKPRIVSKLSKTVPRTGVQALQLAGRHSLGIYVGHLLLFKFIGAAAGLPGFAWFSFEIFE